MRYPKDVKLWDGSKFVKRTVKLCCTEFEVAMGRGTDSDGYGPHIDYRGGWFLGNNLAPINFCPWCGKPVPKLGGK